MTFLSSVPILLIDSSSRNPLALVSAIAVSPNFVQFDLTPGASSDRDNNPDPPPQPRAPLQLHRLIWQPNLTRTLHRRNPTPAHPILQCNARTRGVVSAIALGRRAAASLRFRPTLVEQVLDLRHQLASRERLDNIHIGTGRHSPADLGIAPAGGKHDDFDVPPVGAFAHAHAHLVTAFARHHHVEQHQIGMGGFDKPEGFFAVTRHAYVVSIALQEEFDRRDDARLVIGNQDFLAHVTAPLGRVNEKLAPPPSLLSTHIRPPKCSTIWRLICSPRPVPSGLSVSVLPT